MNEKNDSLRGLADWLRGMASSAFVAQTGDNAETLRRWANEVESSLKTIGGIEPVAWLRRSRHYGIWSEWVVCSKSDVDRVSGLESWQGMPVYTSPLPQLQMCPACFAECAPSERPAAPAQALTDEEIDTIVAHHAFVHVNREGRFTALDKGALRACIREVIAAVGQDSAAPSGATVPAGWLQVGWTIDTGSGRIFDTGASLSDEQRTRWQPVYVALGVNETSSAPDGRVTRNGEQ